MGPVKLTKGVVDGLLKPVPPARQAFVRDSALKGFAVRITASGQRSFVVEGRVQGKTRRITLGKYPNLTVEQARKLAKERLGQIAVGRDPEAEKAHSPMLASATGCGRPGRSFPSKAGCRHARIGAPAGPP